MPKSSQALPWVKAWTKVLTTPKWLALPIEERGVFDYLCRLGGVSSKRGFVEGSDAEIAASIRVDPDLLTKTVARLSAKPFESIKRRRAGLLITGWHDYQPPANYDPALSYGHRPTERSTERNSERNAFGTPKEEGEGEREEEKEGEGEVLRVLRGVRGYPFDVELDSEYVAKLAADFPDVDRVTEAKKFAARTLDHPLGKNPRLALRNWYTNARLFAKRDRRDVVQPLPSVAEQEAALRRGWSA